MASADKSKSAAANKSSPSGNRANSVLGSPDTALDLAKASEPALPTFQDIATLPVWARVAFAARCAERVLPLFKAYRPKPPKKHAWHVDTAILLALSPDAVTADYAKIAAKAAYAVAMRSKGAAEKVAHAAANAALAAANAVYNAADVVTKNAHAAAKGVRAAAKAAGVPRTARYELLAYMHRDIYLLRVSAAQERWDEKPVPRGFTGPLWANGHPMGWPVGMDLLTENQRDKVQPELPEKTTPAVGGASARGTFDRQRGGPKKQTDGVASDVETIRARLRDAVKASHLTYAEIGQKLGYDKETARAVISRVLSPNSKRDPRLSTLLAIAVAINRDLKDLL